MSTSSEDLSPDRSVELQSFLLGTDPSQEPCSDVVTGKSVWWRAKCWDSLLACFKTRYHLGNLETCWKQTDHLLRMISFRDLIRRLWHGMDPAMCYSAWNNLAEGIQVHERNRCSSLYVVFLSSTADLSMVARNGLIWSWLEVPRLLCHAILSIWPSGGNPWICSSGNY